MRVGAVGERDPDARADRDRAVAQLQRVGERVEDALRDASGLVGRVEIVDEDRELVAAEPGDRVEVAEVRVESVGDRDQERVAGEVTEAVVHVLEPVEIDDHDRDVAADARAAGRARARAGR